MGSGGRPDPFPLSPARGPDDLPRLASRVLAIIRYHDMTDERHVWIIDAIEEDVAAIEEDGERLRHVARWLLPAEAREGSVLIVTRRPGADGAVRLDITLDDGAAMRSRDDARTRPRNPSDRGGDIVL